MRRGYLVGYIDAWATCPVCEVYQDAFGDRRHDDVHDALARSLRVSTDNPLVSIDAGTE